MKSSNTSKILASALLLLLMDPILWGQRNTRNNPDPMVVLQLSAGTYGAVVTCGTGRAIIEIYDVTDE